jgi:hypothetical protein
MDGLPYPRQREQVERNMCFSEGKKLDNKNELSKNKRL